MVGRHRDEEHRGHAASCLRFPPASRRDSGSVRSQSIERSPSTPPAPNTPKAQPQPAAGALCPPYTSSTRPNTSGEMAPAPKPRSERMANAAPSRSGFTVSVIPVEYTDESPSAEIRRSEEHTSELRHITISYAVFCLKKKRTSRR